MAYRIPEIPISMARLRRILIFGILAVLAILLWSILRHFVVALTWAVIITMTLWPLFMRLRWRWPRRPGLVSLAMTLSVSVGIVVPLGLGVILILNEASSMGERLQAFLQGRGAEELAETFKGWPIIGELLQDLRDEIQRNPDEGLAIVLGRTQAFFKESGRELIGTLTRNVFTLVVCLFTTYFLFRHGEVVAAQVTRGVRRLGGDRLENLLLHVKFTVKAVVYGLVMTAIAQAIVSAVGFWAFGVPLPLFLGILMFFFSFIPFGPPFIWVPAAVYLLTEGNYWNALFMFAYGTGIISTMDNIFRPLFIGQATQMSIFLVFIGVIGGIMSFGMLGLFVGPVVLAVALALWKDWVSSREATDEHPLGLGMPLQTEEEDDEEDEDEEEGAPEDLEEDPERLRGSPRGRSGGQPGSGPRAS